MLCFISGLGFAQNNIERVLDSIEVNNKSLITGQQQVQTKTLKFHTGNTPENPFFSADYMVGKPVSGGNQLDILAVQSFDFPSVYFHKKNLADYKSEALDFSYERLRQSILLEAKILCIEIYFLHKKMDVNASRIVRADSIVSNYELRYEVEEINALDLNKAKIQLLNLKSKQRSFESQLSLKTEALKALNGGDDIDISSLEFSKIDTVPEFQVLEDSISANDPYLNFLSHQTKINEAKLKLNKAEVLPNLEVGYRYQSVLGQTFNGAHFGLSIPLWQHKNTIKTGKSLIVEHEFQMNEEVNRHFHEVKKLYLKNENLKQTIQEYEQVINGLNSEKILQLNLESGEIDFITYVLELEYLYNATDQLLELKMEYQKVVAELFKYQL